MTDEQNVGGYGFEDDNQGQGGGLVFGLNAGNCYMTKFEFNANGGKDGAEQECLDVVFNVDGRDFSYRQFPVTKAYGKNNVEITDPRDPLMVKARKDFNAIITHILHAFMPIEQIKTTFSVPITSFKQFCDVARAALPPNFDKMKLDVFAQWQWQITGDNDRTYLRLPNKMKHGKWLCKHVPPIGGKWEEVRLNGGLKYVSKKVDETTGKVLETQYHPFVRTKWFMEDSNFSKQQKSETMEDVIPDNIDGGQQINWDNAT